MKQFLTTFLLLLTIGIFSQNTNPPDTLPAPAGFDTTSSQPFIGKPGLLPYNPDKKMSVRLEMGTTFGVGSGNSSLFGVYVAPHISYKVSPRFRVNMGVQVTNSNFINYYNPYFGEYTRTFNQNVTQAFLYAEGEYLVNPRLLVTAKGYKEIATFSDPKINPRALDMDGGGVSVGFNYKITENFHFGAEVGVSKGNSLYDPFYQGSSLMPGSRSFRSSPFNSFDPWP